MMLSACIFVAGVHTDRLQAATMKAGRDQRVWTEAVKGRDDELRLLQRIVNLDSGTGDEAGGKSVAALLADELSRAGLKTELLPAQGPGLAPNLVATLSFGCLP